MLEIQKGEMKFFIQEGQELVGEITYKEDAQGRMVANHTFVNPAYRGQKIAERLLDEMVAYAREQQRKIVPLCSYVVKSFSEKDKYHDVWAKN